MNHKFELRTLTLSLSGHIDTANASGVEKEIFSLLDSATPEKVILNAEQLVYISSSGLRVILRLRKKFADIRIINVSSEVYEILEMTGFTEMMPVEKAYRKLDITGCKMIGKGANGKVYRYDRDTIVKVYNADADLEDIKRERELSRTAFVLGVPTAIPYDVVKVGDCYGSVFELLNAKSFDELIAEDPSNLEFVVQKSVEIAKILHTTTAPDTLPSQSEVALHWVDMIRGYIDQENHAKLKRMIEELPEEGTMIHGDLHLKNIMQQNDETLLIDLDTLSIGNPIYELAFMYNAYKGFGVVDITEVERFMGIPASIAYRIWTRTLEVYCETDDPERLQTIEDKAAIIGYLRLMRRIIRKGLEDTQSGKEFIEACRVKLCDLIPRYDSLAL